MECLIEPHLICVEVEIFLGFCLGMVMVSAIWRYLNISTNKVRNLHSHFFVHCILLQL